MRRALWIAIGSSLMLATACGDGSDDDAGVDAGRDSDVPIPDGGTDAGADADIDAGDPLLDGEVRILRDEAGVPHILAEDLAAAMYGLGFVHAEDRLFQMQFRRLRVQGRLAEHFAVASPSTMAETNFNARLVADDVAMRTIGLARSATENVAAMPAEYRALLEAYAAGVNAQLAERPSLGTAFEATGNTVVDPWTAADALSGWESVGQTFGSSVAGANREIQLFNSCRGGGGCPALTCGQSVIDEAAAVVQMPADGMWPPTGTGRMASFMPVGQMRPPVEVKASQGFVVAGRHLTSGRPLIFGEPQLALEGPSTWYDHHISVPSEGIDARGVGFAGSPGMVIFWNRFVSQTVTAGGGDTTDLFEITLGTAPDTYVVDGVDVPFGSVDERVVLRGGTPVDLVIRTTRYGPIVSDVLNAVPGGRLYAMRSVGDFRSGDHSVIAGIELMRAHSLEAYQDALRHWVTPQVSALYAGVDEDDGESHIAFHSLLGIPDRVTQTIDARDVTGRHPHDGSDSSNDWRGILDLVWQPHVVDPASGYLFNGNHLPVGTWYDAFVYAGIAGNGDTFRSFEMRRRLGSILTGTPVDPAVLHALHVDAESDTIRIFADVLRALQAADTIPADDPRITPRTPVEIGARVLTALERWETEGGGLLDQRSVGSPLAGALQGRFTTAARDDGFACTWGAAQGGASHFLREFAADPSVLGRPEADAVLNAASAAWDDVVGDLGADVSAWSGRTTPEPFTIAYQRNFFCLVAGEGNGCSLDPTHDLTASINHSFTNTITSAHGSSWPFTVDFSDVDGAFTLLAPGVSEEPTSPRFDDQIGAIELKGSGDISGIPVAPLDLSRVTIVEELELFYTAP